MDAQQSLVAAFTGFVAELVTVEKRNIAALTEIARDALQTNPLAAPGLAAVITNRVLQAPASLKLPVLYLLDSVSKNVGEPYLSYFASSLPEVFASTWVAGGPGLQRPLEKLLGTWVGVFPQPVLDAASARLLPKLAAAPQYAAPAAPAYGYAQQYQQQPAPQYHQQPMQQPQYQQHPQPMAPDPRLALQQPAYAAAQQGYGGPVYAPAPQPMYAAAPAAQPTYAAQQPYPAGPAAPYPQQPYQQQQQPLQPPPLAPPPLAPRPAVGNPAQPSVAAPALPDIMSSLLSAGLLPAPGPPSSAGGAGPPSAAAAPQGAPASLEFSAERIKDLNAGAVQRLLAQTEATKTRFLDRKFLRRQKLGGGLRASRMWYVDLDTWMASTTGGGAAAVAQTQQKQQQEAAAAAEAEDASEPVDDLQTHCALSGERFEQYWEERYQEWRYRGAKRLSAEEAARHGLEEDALVLVSALGAPAPDPLQAEGGVGVLAGLQAEQAIAADLAAVAEAGAEASAPAGEAAADAKPDLKRALEEDGKVVVEEGAPSHDEKRQRLDGLPAEDAAVAAAPPAPTEE